MKRERRHFGGIRRRQAFSLVELVIVVTIIGIISAIAVPRLSNAAEGANSSALQATITTIRKSIDQYYAEHMQYPGYDPSTNAPDGTRFVDQLTMFSDFDGNTQATPGAKFVYGPYLRLPFPRSPVNKLDTVFVKATPASTGPASGTAGWVSVLSHGYFTIAASDAELEVIGVDSKTRTRLLSE